MTTQAETASPGEPRPAPRRTPLDRSVVTHSIASVLWMQYAEERGREAAPLSEADRIVASTLTDYAAFVTTYALDELLPKAVRS